MTDVNARGYLVENLVNAINGGLDQIVIVFVLQDAREVWPYLCIHGAVREFSEAKLQYVIEEAWSGYVISGNFAPDVFPDFLEQLLIAQQFGEPIDMDAFEIEASASKDESASLLALFIFPHSHWMIIADQFKCQERAKPRSGQTLRGFTRFF